MTHPDDTAFMRRALDLAERGLFTTTPNPRVGCVLVRDGRIIGEGFHERAGGMHAEVAALRDARARGESTQGATAYVTLEPCNHTGRTGPCTEALLDAGIARVVAAMADPNPEAAHGAVRLRGAGVTVEIGTCEAAARAQNAGFIARMQRGWPWVRMKVASSLDGRTALLSGESRWITDVPARADGHRFRARACAILTGIGTVRQDDPELSVRAIATPRQPLRVVVDARAEVPPGARVLAGGNALVATAGARNPAWPAGVEAVALPAAADGKVDLAALLRLLGARGMNEVHVEAGARLNGALLRAGLVDEVLAYVAPSILGDPAAGIASFEPALDALGERVRLRFDSVERVGADLRVLATVVRED